MREIRLSGSMRGGELFARYRDGQLPAYSTAIWCELETQQPVRCNTTHSQLGRLAVMHRQLRPREGRWRAVGAQDVQSVMKLKPIQ